MKRDRDDKKKTRFVRYKEGVALYSMCQTKFDRLAKNANAIYKVDKLVLVNLSETSQDRNADLVIREKIGKVFSAL